MARTKQVANDNGTSTDETGAFNTGQSVHVNDESKASGNIGYQLTTNGRLPDITGCAIGGSSKIYSSMPRTKMVADGNGTYKDETSAFNTGQSVHVNDDSEASGNVGYQLATNGISPDQTGRGIYGSSAISTRSDKSVDNGRSIDQTGVLTDVNTEEANYRQKIN